MTARADSVSPSLCVEQHGGPLRAVWRGTDGKEEREPVATRADAELFQSPHRAP
jgi:hypothetical protein